MSTYDIDISPSSIINQQVAGEVFSVLPEDGPLVVILDGQGNYWPSDAEKYSILFCDSYKLDQILARIDDGDDPVISDIGDCPVVASQLATKERHCGYVIIALEGHSPERIHQNHDSIEMTLSLINVIGNFVEKYNNICQFQNKYLNFAKQQEKVCMN
mgnify:CR=1 FL=1